MDLTPLKTCPLDCVFCQAVRPAAEEFVLATPRTEMEVLAGMFQPRTSTRTAD